MVKFKKSQWQCLVELGVQDPNVKKVGDLARNVNGLMRDFFDHKPSREGFDPSDSVEIFTERAEDFVKAYGERIWGEKARSKNQYEAPRLVLDHERYGDSRYIG